MKFVYVNIDMMMNIILLYNINKYYYIYLCFFLQVTNLNKKKKVKQIEKKVKISFLLLFYYL